MSSFFEDLASVPTEFNVNVETQEPVEVKFKIGPNIMLLGVATLAVLLLWKTKK